MNAFIAKTLSDYLYQHCRTPLVFVGHSKGGAHAALNALVTSRPALTFNASGLSKQTKVAFDVVHKAETRITAYCDFFDPIFQAQDYRDDDRLELPNGEIFILLHRTAISDAEALYTSNSESVYDAFADVMASIWNWNWLGVVKASKQLAGAGLHVLKSTGDFFLAMHSIDRLVKNIDICKDSLTNNLTITFGHDSGAQKCKKLRAHFEQQALEVIAIRG